jgi:glutathione peroxidase
MAMTTVYDFEANTADGTPVKLDHYSGKTLLIVNTASKCGFAQQLAGLEELYKQFRGRGLLVLGFPCAQFGQEMTAEATEIGVFCRRQFGVSFPLFDKIDVNGDNTHPLFKWLKSSAPGIFWTPRIKWNFTKFLVDRNGEVRSRFAPFRQPQGLAGAVERLL